MQRLQPQKSFEAYALSLDRLARAAFWTDLNPGMTVSDYPFRVSADRGVRAEYQSVQRCVQQMREEGYFRLDGVLPKERVARMARTVETLVSAGFPPAFAYVYDDFWQVFRDLSPLLAPMYGEHYRIATNAWAWHIPPNDHDHGFKPHRDLVGRQTLYADGSPIFGTVWIPLTDVTTQHSCMYVLPTSQDPNVPGRMHEFAVPHESVQAIRALPGEAGSAMGWNSYALHWGSKSSKWASGPRISIATYIKRAEEQTFNSVSIQPNQYLSLEARLAVIGLNMAHYDVDDITEARYPKKLMAFCEHYTRKFRAPARPQSIPAGSMSKAGRNDPCPCNSGKKFKHCHGQG